jgi:trimethylamine--corrinoid protein Co-methyltransferase
VDRREVSLWPGSAIDAIERATRDLLSTVGMAVQSEAVRDLMVEYGCTESDGGRVTIPWEVVEKASAAAPRTFTLVARDDARSLVVGEGGTAPRTHPLAGAPSVVDPDTGEQRPATLADVSAAVRVQHHCEHPDLVLPLFGPSGLPGDLEPLVSYVACLAQTDKCISGPGLWSVAQVRGLCRLAQDAVGGDVAQDRYAISLAFSPLSPLSFGAGPAEALVEAARLGAACTVLPCPLAGTTAPAPLAAALAQQTAEALCGLVVAQAARPGTPVTYGSRLMPCDSRTGQALMGGPEIGSTAQAATILAHRYGMRCDVYGLSSDSRVIDVQCGFERAIGALLASIARPDFVSGMGLMQAAVGGSLEMLVIDDEISRWIRWSLEERPADETVLDVAEMQRGALSGAGFLGIRQTREYLRTEKVQSRLSFRGSQESWSAEESMLERARRKVAEALAQEPVGLDGDVLVRAGAVIAETAEEMGIDDAPDLLTLLDASQVPAPPTSRRDSR